MKTSKKLYIVYNYPDTRGEPDKMIGVFSSIDRANECLKDEKVKTMWGDNYIVTIELNKILDL